MCSYCGCEAEPVVKALMDDHVEIVALMSEILDAVEEGSSERAAKMTTQLAELFGRHAETEEAGLFHQLVLAGEATEEIDRLLEDHRRLRSGLSDPAVTLQTVHLRQLFVELHHHAEIEETDLFPFALQVMPPQSWSIIRQVASRN